MYKEIKKQMKNIEKLSKQLGYPITSDDYYICDLGCPHKPKSLPNGYSAVYIFKYKSKYLKIGKANSKSNVRFRNQHYGFNANSTLAKSLNADPVFKKKIKSKNNTKNWMLDNLHRIDILIKTSKGKAATELIESVLHYSLRPKYEGNI